MDGPATGSDIQQGHSKCSFIDSYYDHLTNVEEIEISRSISLGALRANTVISCTSEEVKEESIGIAEDSDLDSSQYELDEDAQKEGWGPRLKGCWDTVHCRNTVEGNSSPGRETDNVCVLS